MSEFDELLKNIKKAAVEAVEAAKPMSVCFGVVMNTKPLEIKVEQKMTLKLAQLILTRNVTDYNINLSMDHVTEAQTHTHAMKDLYLGGDSIEYETHNHSYKGEKQFTVHNSLKVGEEVILLQTQGGQKYIVLDKVV